MKERLRLAMLKMRHLIENYELAKDLLKNWEYDEEDLDEMLSYFRISSNAIYPFRYKKQVRFIRIAPIDEKRKENIYGELEFIQYLREHDFKALCPVPSKNGELIRVENTKWGEYYATVFEKVTGKQVEDCDYSEKMYYECGKTMGKMHRLSSKYNPVIKKWTHEDVLNEIETMLTLYQCTNKAKIELANLRVELAKLSKNHINYGLIHYDFELDNVFYDEKTNTCSVIDFDDGMYHWYSADIEQFLESVSEEKGELDAEQVKTEFYEGYQSEYPILEETKNNMPLMRRFINLYSYMRILHCLSDSFTCEPEWMTELRVKLTNMLKSIEETWKF
jgi:Ser/Thr protein kinase RdoA (MazF antagonist)